MKHQWSSVLTWKSLTAPDTDENKRTLSDKDIKDLVSDRYNIDLFNLQNMEQEIQDGTIKYLKKTGDFLRQLSRLTGFVYSRIIK